MLGTMNLVFEIEGKHLSAAVAVTDAIDELILGIDWLTQEQCNWNFAESKLTLHGHTLPLYSRPVHARVRRIYIAKDQDVPARHQADIPVTVTKDNLRISQPDCIFESKSIRPKVMIARTLISGDSTSSYLRVVNCSDVNQKFHVDECLGRVEPAIVVNSHTDIPITMTEYKQTSPKEALSSSFASMDENLEHVRDVIQSLPTCLSDEERNRAEEFVCSHAHVFSKSEFDLGRTTVATHRIDTGNNRPFKEALRRHPIAYLPIIDEHVEKMLQHDIIEPAASPWASNVVLIKRADGGLRFCIDYRHLNRLTYKDSYPLPRIEDCLNSLGSSKFFSTLDLRSSYWQTEIDQKDRDKTAFVTRRGSYRFKVLSFGLANAPAFFQRLMDCPMSVLTWEACFVFLDDVIVFAKDLMNTWHGCHPFLNDSPKPD